MKGRCPWCRRPRISLRNDGTQYKHLRYRSSDNGSLAPECKGSGKAPNEHPSRQRRQSQS